MGMVRRFKKIPTGEWLGWRWSSCLERFGLLIEHLAEDKQVAGQNVKVSNALELSRNTEECLTIYSGGFAKFVSGALHEVYIFNAEKIGKEIEVIRLKALSIALPTEHDWESIVGSAKIEDESVVNVYMNLKQCRFTTLHDNNTIDKQKTGSFIQSSSSQMLARLCPIVANMRPSLRTGWHLVLLDKES